MAALPKTEEQAACIVRSRDAIHRIHFGDDPRLLVVVGPCSIHDLDAGREYGRRLAAIARELEDRMVIASYGQYKPRVPNRTPEGNPLPVNQSLNRRVSIHVVPH